MKTFVIPKRSPANTNIEAEWRMYASVKHAAIDSNNGLSPVRRQAIIWTNAALLSIKP